MAEQKKQALAYLMFLKQKWCKKIKGHGCPDGRKQHACTAHEDVASLTVATESVFLTVVINDMKSHTRGTMSMGKGAIYSTSAKQKFICHTELY